MSCRMELELFVHETGRLGSKVTGDKEMHPDSICAVVVTYNPCVGDIAHSRLIQGWK